VVDEVLEFLPCETPESWLQAALANLDVLLIDHANCEKKAAATAMSLLYRHIDKADLLVLMARLAREELLHFQQVVDVMAERGINYRRLGPSRYAGSLRQHIDHEQQGGLVDILVIGALVEARSCERFCKLAPHLDERLGKFYRGLIRSESRHFRDYLDLARKYAESDLQQRLDYFSALERDLVLSKDTQLRFHSGVPSE
jgi:tRNA-(ms[2]io[6]A)-hydroxylase